MMKCEEIEKLLLLYKAGECNEAEQAIVERHIAGCAVCSSKMQSVQRMHALINASRDKLVPAGENRQAIDEIMRLTISQPAGTSLNPMYRRLEVFRRVAFRYAATILFTGLVSLFLMQNYADMNRLSQLEAQYGKQNTHAYRPGTQAGFHTASMDRQLKRLAQKGLFVDNTLVDSGKLSANSVNKLVRQWKNLCASNPQACKRIAQMYAKNLKEIKP